MRGQQRRSGAVARATRGLAALAAGLTCLALLAPVAAASPIGDADNAMTAAWKDAGGDNSDLGAKQGEAYVAGAGFAQDFVHGKMFFTPATGPRSMTGAILDKYESLGGPAASDLGFPTISEAHGLAGPDSRVSIFSASDKPLIYWTAEHGAFVVRGAINAAWDKLGSSAGALGVPVGDETFDGELATQAFSGGTVSWNRLTKAFTTVPPDLANQLTDLQVPVDPTADINMAWRAAGGVSGPLGAKQGDQYPIGTGGLAQNFIGGKIFFSPVTGANAVETDILTKYESLGGPGGSDLGFPVANEADGGLKPASRVSAFSASDKPVVFWTPDHGAFVVRGAIKAAWDKLGGATGKLGAPLGDRTVNKDIVTQKFIGGQIAWNQTKNAFTTEPANLASALSGLQVPGQKTPAGTAPSGDGVRALAWHWRWLLVGIPVLLLIGLAVLVTRRWRRRRAAKRNAKAVEDGAVVRPSPSLSPNGRRMPTATRCRRASPTITGRCVRAPCDCLLSRPANGCHRALRIRLTSRLMTKSGVPMRFPASPTLTMMSTKTFDEDFDDHPDDVDTTPTGIPSAGEARGGRHAAVDADDDDAQVTAALSSPRIVPGQLAIHLPLEDPYHVPDGYPVKANASFGLYCTPDSALYEEIQAEIWFASEEIAQVNGFHKAG